MATLTTSYQKIATSSTVSFNGATGKIELYAKYNSQNIANNTTNYSIQPRLVVANGYIGEYTGSTLTISGTGLTTSTTSKGTGNFTSQTLGILTGNVTHNADGTKSVSMSSSIRFTAWGKTISVSGSADLPKIPRYATSNQSLNSKTETTIKMNWSSNSTIDYLWYSKDNGSSWTGVDVADGTSGTYTISGLSANTTYNIKTRVRRKDSQLTTDSSSLSVTTYNYPYCTSTPNFTIGNALILSFYNPLGRSITVKGYSNSSGGQIFSGSTTGTSMSGFNDTNSVNSQYNSIPNATSSKYKVTVTYGNAVMTRDAGNTYSINANNCKPVFKDFTYSTNLSELTGNNNTIIDAETTTTFIISTANKATGQYGATIKRYHFECGNQTNDVNYSSTNQVSSTITKCASNILKITAIDSRGLETTVSKTVSNYKNYTKPVFLSLNADRKDGVDKESYLDLKIGFWNGNFGLKNNELKTLKYRNKQSNSTTWSDWFEININKLTTSNSEAILTDYLIHLDGISGGFTIGVSYDIQIEITDGADDYILSTVYSDLTKLMDGKVSFSILKDNNGEYHIGINGMPDLNNTLKVHGTISSN